MQKEVWFFETIASKCGFCGSLAKGSVVLWIYGARQKAILQIT